MTMELVAFLAPAPSINSRFEFQRRGIGTCFSVWVGVLLQRFWKGKNYGNENEF
jgi:hypothetical protein